MIQHCGSCNKEFFVSAFIAGKKYCSETCRRRAKANRKRDMDALVSTNTETWYEVGNHPSFMQLSEVARAMLMGVTKKPSMFTSVMVKFNPPKGLTWTVTDDGRGLLDFESMSVMERMKQGEEVTLMETPQAPARLPLPPRDTRTALEIAEGRPVKPEPDFSRPL